MHFYVDRHALIEIVKVLGYGAIRVVPRERWLQLIAEEDRVVVQASGLTAFTEALVLEPGSCWLPRRQFLKLLHSYRPKRNINIEADSARFRIERLVMSSFGYSASPQQTGERASQQQERHHRACRCGNGLV